MSAGPMPSTEESPASERDAVAPNATIPMHRAAVDSVEVLGPDLVEVRLGGLRRFDVLGPDTFAFAIVATGSAPLDETFVIGEYQAARAEGRARGAYYTVRNWDPDRAVVTFWVFVHGHDDGVGSWLASARPGDDLLLWGPRQGFVPPSDADHLLLVSDETGFAAVASIIESAAPDVRVEAVLEATDAAHRPQMPRHPALTVHWVDRGEDPPGSGHGLADAVRTVDTGTGVWAAFGAGESRVVTRLRTIVRRERAMPASHVSMAGYWRRE